MAFNGFKEFSVDNKHPEGRLLIRVSEAAEMLSIARTKAYLLVQDGTLPSVRLGRSVRVPVDALRAWLSEQQSAVVRNAR
jgi:excisionase family DNA binding protein